MPGVLGRFPGDLATPPGTRSDPPGDLREVPPGLPTPDLPAAGDLGRVPAGDLEAMAGDLFPYRNLFGGKIREGVFGDFGVPPALLRDFKGGEASLDLPSVIPGVPLPIGGVPMTLVADFLRRDLPGVKPAAWLGLELAGDEYMLCFQTTLRPGVVEGGGAFFFAEEPTEG